MTFKEKAQKFGVELSNQQIEMFDEYYNILIEKNKVMNLTAITEYEEVIDKHFVDSISINKFEKFNDLNSVIDVGTGAGFHGIPLKIAFPDKRILLMDSLNKRINFLNEVIDKLDLKNIETIHSRAEDLAKKAEHREKYDLCVSRAVANLTTLSEYCLPFVNKGGYFVSYKSEKLDEEMKEAEFAINLLGGKKCKQINFILPETDNIRNFAIIQKIKNTPKKYPRSGAKPSKEPLHK